METALSKSFRISAALNPRAFKKTVMCCRRLRSIRTPTVSFLSTSNSSQAPRDGMILAMKMSLSVVLSGSLLK